MTRPTPEDLLDFACPMGPQLVAVLRRKIIHTEWEPGQRLSETEVAAAFGVSRQPIREAFIKLREEGLIEIRPQRGSFVRKISRANVLDGRFVREAIEADIVALVAGQADADLVGELEELIAEQKSLSDTAQFMAVDDRFHRRLAQAAGHLHAWEVVEAVKAQLDRVRHLASEHFPKERVIREHSAIVAAIAQGDAPKAEAHLRHHLRGLVADLPQIEARFAAFFD